MSTETCPTCGAGRAGRPAIDDDEAIAYARSLLAAGLARNRGQALRRAAALFVTTSVESTIRRLRRKWETDKTLAP